MRNRSSWMAACALVVLMGAVEARGQGFSGVSCGYAASWPSTVGVACPTDLFVQWYWIREGFEDVIEGSGGELEREGEEKALVVEGLGGAGGLGEYRVIDYARDLMRGRFSRDTRRGADDAVDIGLDPLKRLTREEVLEGAIGAYGKHLEEFPEDWIVVREMAVALLAAGRVDDAMNMMHEAYVHDPELGIFPINGALLGESDEPMMKLVVRAVKRTHQKPSAEGWLLVGVLMQAQGRVELAGEMLDRADELGLEAKISRGLRESLP